LKSPARRPAGSGAPADTRPTPWWPAIVLAGLCLLAYSNSFTAGFPLDNKALVLLDTRVHAATAENVDLILHRTYWWPIGESGLYRPVTTLSYLFNYAILGNADRPFGYHVVNLAFHVANVLLLFALLRRFLIPHPKLPITPLAFAPAALWAVHPLATEAVTNIVGRADLMAACAVLTGLLAFVRSSDAKGTRRFGWLLVLSLATLAGVFAKESAVVVAPLVVLTAICLPITRRGVVPALLAMAPPLALLWIARASVLGSAPAAEFPFVDNPIVGLDFWRGRLTALAVITRYLWLMVWPVRLSADYSYAQIPPVEGRAWMVIAIATAVLVALSFVWLWRRNRTAFLFAAFAAITFLPASNLLFPIGTIMAERVMYLPSAGLLALAAFLAAPLAAGPTVRRALALALCLILAGFAARTWLRNRDWRDDVSLWTAAAEAAPHSFKVHRGLAEVLYEADKSPATLIRVIAENEAALAILAPLPDALNDAKTYRQAGADYVERADVLHQPAGEPPPAGSEARREYERAASLIQREIRIVDAATGPLKSGVAADGYRLLSAIYVRLHDAGKAVDTATKALTLDPENVVGYRQAAAAFLSAARNEDAAIALMTGGMVTNDNSLAQELIDLYQRGLDPLRCAVRTTSNGPSLNPSCETVRRHACAATPEAVRIHERAGRADQAARLREGAARQFRCSQG
jgi:protein O-mannosyl-transferase